MQVVILHILANTCTWCGIHLVVGSWPHDFEKHLSSTNNQFLKQFWMLYESWSKDDNTCGNVFHPFRCYMHYFKWPSSFLLLISQLYSKDLGEVFLKTLSFRKNVKEKLRQLTQFHLDHLQSKYKSSQSGKILQYYTYSSRLLNYKPWTFTIRNSVPQNQFTHVNQL